MAHNSASTNLSEEKRHFKRTGLCFSLFYDYFCFLRNFLFPYAFSYGSDSTDLRIFQKKYLFPVLIKGDPGLHIRHASGNLHNHSETETVVFYPLPRLQFQYRSRNKISIRHSHWNTGLRSAERSYPQKPDAVRRTVPF